MKRFRVEKRQQLAHFLKEKLGGSIKAIRRQLEQNCCKVNGKVERFGSAWLNVGNIIEFATFEKGVAKWTLLFDHVDFQIVDKPVGWVCSEQNCEKTFGRDLFLVHRLDKDTTGALILAKNARAKTEFEALFAARAIDKEYLALVDGVICQDQGTIDNTLAKKGSFQGQTIWGSSSRGEHAVTHWKVVSRFLAETLVSCKPLTGRTHQIRVHMAEMGHPLLTDRQYAHHFRSKILASRPLLHAYRLAFTYRGMNIDIVCSIPSDLKSLLHYLNN